MQRTTSSVARLGGPVLLHQTALLVRSYVSQVSFGKWSPLAESPVILSFVEAKPSPVEQLLHFGQRRLAKGLDLEQSEPDCEITSSTAVTPERRR